MTIVTETPVVENASSVQIVDAAITDLKGGDTGAHWKDSVIKAARKLYEEDKPLYQRKRTALRNASSDSQITEWTKEVQSGASNKDAEQRRAADNLVKLVQDTATLFHSPDGECYAAFEQDDHRETWSLTSKGFSDWLGYRAYKELGFSPTENAMNSVLGTLRGIAKHDGKEQEVYLRCAPWKDGYLIDLTNEKWQVVEVLPKGWNVLDESPVSFVRSQNAAPLPTPTRNKGTLDLLWGYANIPKSHHCCPVKD